MRLLIAFFLCLSIPQWTHAAGEEFVVGKVTAIISTHNEESPEGSRIVQNVEFQLLDGTHKRVQYENGILPDREETELKVGQKVVLSRLEKVNGSELYIMREPYRMPRVLWLLAAFFVMAALLGRRTGIMSTLGLIVSIGILTIFLVPSIAEGRNPLLVSIISCIAIASTSLYLAHGWNRRTTIALCSTLTILILSIVIATFAVKLTLLFGGGSEEAIYLQSGFGIPIDLKGLLLAGIVIGCLGVLDDITTAQTAVIDELQRANPSLSSKQLLHAGMSVGREHIASLINTLALAYVGSSLPLLLLFRMQSETPLWVILNSEFLSEEIVRTVVGSMTLLCAVPLSTWMAVVLLPRGTLSSSSHTHVHRH